MNDECRRVLSEEILAEMGVNFPRIVLFARTNAISKCIIKFDSLTVPYFANLLLPAHDYNKYYMYFFFKK